MCPCYKFFLCVFIIQLLQKKTEHWLTFVVLLSLYFYVFRNLYSFLLYVCHFPFQKSSSETDLNLEADQVSCPSEIGDDSESVHSAADQSDSAHEEYISSRGVRFTSQQHVRDGKSAMNCPSSQQLRSIILPCLQE